MVERDPQGAEHRSRIAEVVRRIPAGHVATYGQIARLAGLPNHARLVGRVLASVEDADLPWHRVVNAGGRISRRGGGGERNQMRLLSAEGVQFDERGRIDLGIYAWPERGSAGRITGGPGSANVRPAVPVRR